MKRILYMALLLLAPLPVRAQAAGDATQRIEAAKRRAEASGIPVALLASKVAEGNAKGYPAERVAMGVEARLALLIRARDAMAGAGRAPLQAADLSAGADALAAGVSSEALASLTRAAPADRRAVAIAVLAQLVQEGEASGRALERVQVALGNPESLRNLPSQGKRGVNPLEQDRPGIAHGGNGAAGDSPPAPGLANAGKPAPGDQSKKKRRRP